MVLEQFLSKSIICTAVAHNRVNNLSENTSVAFVNFAKKVKVLKFF